MAIEAQLRDKKEIAYLKKAVDGRREKIKKSIKRACNSKVFLFFFLIDVTRECKMKLNALGKLVVNML